MTESIEKKFMDQIQAYKAIIHKVVNLYCDDFNEREDLYQEVLLQSWKSFSNFRGDAKFSTWLYKVALNTVFSVNKKNKKAKFTDTIQNHKIVEESPDEEYEMLYEIIKSLNPIDRMIMTLHLDGYKNKEIAEITGMKNNHLNVKIHRLKTNIIATFKRIDNE